MYYQGSCYKWLNMFSGEINAVRKRIEEHEKLMKRKTIGYKGNGQPIIDIYMRIRHIKVAGAN
mgnify:CR=1 FL=1